MTSEWIKGGKEMINKKDNNPLTFAVDIVLLFIVAAICYMIVKLVF